jgi:nonribosomal peptide synthetase DhbF
MPGTRVCLVDESGRLCEPGAVGEIFIKTPYRALGYLGQAELTAAKFVADPEGSPDLAYRTGDLARLNVHGEYEYIGRADNQVKIRGVRIELEEIEAVFSTHEAITDVAAIARQDSRGDMELACYCVLKSPASANNLRDYAAARLPRLMLPSVIRVVSSLPHTSNGKLDRRALAQSEPSEITTAPISAALTGTELMLTALFREVLHLADVDPSASFFVLGGQSLLAIDLLARIDEALSIELSLGELFKHSSVSTLASVIDARMEARHA